MSKKVLAALLAVCMVASLLFVPAAAATFNDVDEDHWASGAIERWAGYGVLNGKDAEAGIFDPSAPMTRAEFAKMLVEMLGLTAKSDTTFDDVDPEAWYADVVSIAVKAGIISGRPGNKFDPTAPVTFEEAAVMMCRAFGLAQVTSGAEWAKESIEKLTSLGMIGEGADEHLQVGVDCDRAVVAALADAVVKEYVNEDREEPITGEVNGVVLVVKGAKVEIKDATVSAPIVVESAEVTLTGTKAEDVKVSGKDAAIAADEASTVASVTLAGEAPKADIKGEVASVTIAEETTGAVVDAPKAAEDAIVNNSTEEATVNGEAVEGKPEEPADPENPENPEDTTPGSVSGNDAPEALPRPIDPDAECDHAWSGWTMFSATVHRRSCSKCGATEEENHTYPTPAEGAGANTAANSACTKCGYTTKTSEQVSGTAPAGHTHEWASTADAGGTEPTCTEAGVKVYSCTAKIGADAENGVEGTACTAKKTVTTPATGHTWDEGEVTTEPTCTKAGVKTYTCTVDSCGATKTESIEKIDHDFSELVRVTKAATCKDKGEKLMKCANCNNNIVVEIAVDENAHDWSGKDGVCKNNSSHKCPHTDVAAGETCGVCGYKVPAATGPDEGDDGDDDTPHTHSYTWTNVTESSATGTCNGCAVGTEGHTITCNHASKSYTSVDTTNHKVTCTGTCKQEIKATEAHSLSWDTTGDHKQHCANCSYTAECAADHSQIASNAKCPTCGADGTGA